MVYEGRSISHSLLSSGNLYMANLGIPFRVDAHPVKNRLNHDAVAQDVCL